MGYDVARRRMRYEDYTVSGAPTTSDLNYGLFIDYGIRTFAHPGEKAQVPAERFTPDAPDVKAWVRVAKAAGMTFAVLTAKDQPGFCLWESADRGYGAVWSRSRGDIIGDFISACNTQNIWPGVDYSISDEHREGEVRHEDPVSPAQFDLIKRHLAELHAKYPGIRVQLLEEAERLTDDQYDDICHLIRQTNPRCVLLNKGGKKDRGLGCAFVSVTEGSTEKPQEGSSWVGTLLFAYEWARDAGLICLVGVRPEPSGRIPKDHVTVLRQLQRRVAEIENQEEI